LWFLASHLKGGITNILGLAAFRMTAQKPCVAFVIHDIIHYRASLSIARAIESEFRIHLYFIDEILLETFRSEIPETYLCDSIFTAVTRKLNFAPTHRRIDSAPGKPQISIQRRVFLVLRLFMPKPIRRFLWRQIIRSQKYMFPLALWRHWIRATVFRRALKLHRPDVLMLNQADIENMSETYIGCARKLGIKTIVNPFTFCTTESMLRYFETRLHRSLAGKFDRDVLQPLFPQWFHPFGKHVLMRTDPMTFVATTLLGYRYAQPWNQDYSSADALLVDNAIALDHYRKMGFPETQLHALGLPEHDVLAQRLENKLSLYKALCQEYDLDCTKPLVVIALPPEYELGLARSEFSSFHEFVSFVQSPFYEAGNWNVMLCQHPRSPLHDYVCPKERVRLAKQATFDLIPLSDAYVSFVSVTIKWANFCGIPALNYDVYAMKDFAHLETENIISVETKAEYVKAATGLCTDDAYYAKWRAIQQKNRHQWGNTEGTAQQKLTALLHALIRARGKATPTTEGTAIQAPLQPVAKNP
jgi:hypothetical protein